MEEIRRHVAAARRRLVLQQFLSLAPWSLFAALLLATVALAVPKVWFLGLETTIWTWGWIGGAVVAGLVAAGVGTLVGRRSMMDAAVEIDRRFGLKERVSSALSLACEDRDTQVGRALIQDASRRLETIAVKDRFTMAAGWRAALPLLPALCVFILATFVPDASRDKATEAAEQTELRQRIKKSTEKLRQQLDEQRARAEREGLKDAEELFKKIHQGLEDLANKDKVDHKRALVEMNDLAEEIEKRRKALGDEQKMKEQFGRLKDLDKGPARELSDALKQGDFQKAIEELEQLRDELESGKMSEADKQKLAEQLKEMQQKLQETVESHEQAKRDLEQQIRQQEAEGDLEAAGKLQRKLDQLQKQDRQTQRMQDMAENMGDAAQCMQNGDSGDSGAACDQLDELASQMQQMQSEMSELESLGETMDQFAGAKSEMRGEQASDTLNPFGGASDQPSELPGDGLGEGQGYGQRPEEQTETGEEDARQRAKPQAGEAVRIGDAAGPNQAGLSTEGLKEQINSSLSNEADPLIQQRLPKAQQDHVRQYYQRLGKDQ